MIPVCRTGASLRGAPVVRCRPASGVDAHHRRDKPVCRSSGPVPDALSRRVDGPTDNPCACSPNSTPGLRNHGLRSQHADATSPDSSHPRSRKSLSAEWRISRDPVAGSRTRMKHPSAGSSTSHPDVAEVNRMSASSHIPTQHGMALRSAWIYPPARHLTLCAGRSAVAMRQRRQEIADRTGILAAAVKGHQAPATDSGAHGRSRPVAFLEARVLRRGGRPGNRRHQGSR